MLKLYVGKNSSAFASVVCLEEAGLDYQLQVLDLAAGEHRDAPYLTVNPHAMVPALAVGDEIITETIAILTYISCQAPESDLLPRDCIARAKAYETLSWFASTVHVALSQVLRGERFTNDEESKKAVAERGLIRFGAAAAEFEAMASRDTEWLIGDHFTVVDAVGLVAWRWLKRLELDPLTYPNWAAKVDKALTRPSILRALQREDA